MNKIFHGLITAVNEHVANLRVIVVVGNHDIIFVAFGRVFLEILHVEAANFEPVNLMVDISRNIHAAQSQIVVGNQQLRSIFPEQQNFAPVKNFMQHARLDA